MAVDMNATRRLGKWIRDWPCKHGYHEWSLWRPGLSMWIRQCEHCRAPEMMIRPKHRAECDLEYYNNVYLPKFTKKERAA